MKRSIGDLSNEQVTDLLLLYCSLTEDGRSTKESIAVRRQQFETSLAKKRAELGLSEGEATELSVVLEHNRRNHWMTLAAINAKVSAGAAPATAVIGGLT